MGDHPCDDGLSEACFKAFPEWVRRALAYKLLFVLLPKDVLSVLKSGLDLPFIGPGAVLPGGVELSMGSMIPPNFVVPLNWVPWFNMVFSTDEDPRVMFAVDWKYGDPLPLGVELAPGYNIPGDWTPADPPHPVYLPGYNPFPRPGDWSGVPPLFVQAWEPGPPHRPPPPVPLGWTQILSDDYWEPWFIPWNGGYAMSWDGLKWLVLYGGPDECSNWPALNPKTGTTWSVNYRPSQARVTFTGGVAPIEIGFCDTAGNVLGHNLACVSPQIIDLDFFLGNDIKRLNTANISMYITNIEFK